MSAPISRKQGLLLSGTALAMSALPGLMLVYAAHQSRQDRPQRAQAAANLVARAPQPSAARKATAEPTGPRLPLERPALAPPRAAAGATPAAPWRDGREIGTRILYCAQDPANCARIVRVLDQPTRLDCQAMPLSHVAAHLERTHRISVTLDRETLADAGIDPETPVTARLGGISLQAALHRILDPLRLEAVIQNGFLVIVPRDQARRTVTTVIYEADDLAPPARDADPNFAELEGLIETMVEPDAWSQANGGDALVQPMLRTLVITAEPGAHEQVRRLLRALRAALARQKTAPAEARYLPVSADASPGDAHVRAALKQPIDLALADEPLKQALDSLGRQLQIRFVVDAQSLDDNGISLSEKVSADFSRVTAKAALTRLLRRLDLGWTVRNGAVLIASPRYCEPLELRVYPVGDLAETVGDFDYEQMVTAVAGTAAGPGHVRPAIKEFRLGKCLVVAHDDDGHDRVETLLAALRRSMAGREPPLRRQELVLSVYLLPPARSGQKQPTCQELKELLMNVVEPQSWQGRGGQGSIYILTGALVVRNSQKAQAAAAALLKQFGVVPRQDDPAAQGGFTGNFGSGFGGGMSGWGNSGFF
jgi:hypothetical protein